MRQSRLARAVIAVPPLIVAGLLTVLVSITLPTAGWDPPIAAADEGTPVVINCSQPPQVKPEHIILTCADNTLAVDKIVWTKLIGLSPRRP